MQAATLATIGPDLASKLGATPYDRALFVVFKEAESNGSALCIYPMKVK